MEDNDTGFSRKIIEQMEAKIDAFTFEGIIERLDAVFNKQWSFRFEGPHLVNVPSRVPRNKKAKNPQSFITTEVAHWQCTCSITINIGEVTEITREYSVLVSASDDSSFAIARDLSLILAAYYGFGVGKKSNIVIEDFGISAPIKLEWGGVSEDDLKNNLNELDYLKKTLGIKINSELDPYVNEFSEGDLSSHKHITRSNLKEFCEFLKSKIEQNAQPSRIK